MVIVSPPFIRLLCLLTLLTLTSAVRADAQAPRLVTSTVTPWGIDLPGQAPRGMLVDLQRELLRQAGLPFRNTMKPYPRVIADIESGEADLAIMFVSPEAERIGISLGQVATERVVIAVRANAPAVQSLDDLSGRLVGQVRGSRYGAAFDEHPGIIRVPVTEVEQGLLMLLAGRIDAMASTEHSLLYALYNAGMDAADIRIALPLFTVRADLYLSRQVPPPPWRAPLEQTLKTMRDNHSLSAALYSQPYWPYTTFCFAGNHCLQPVLAYE